MMSNFLSDETGAITVDWVVLTAFLVGLAIAVVSIISIGARQPANGLNSSLSANIVNDGVSFD
jgi:Flp pilus assembly pilin Flp